MDRIDPNMKKMVLHGLAAVGLFKLFIFTCKALINVYKFYVRPAVNVKKLGKWCVITGATDGIGRAYADAFAKKGMSVLLISRTKAKLEAACVEIKKANEGKDIEVDYAVCDYSDFNDKAQKALKKKMEGLDIGVLINNVGVSYTFPQYFHELDEEEVFNLMEMNIASVSWMTRFILPGMMEKKRGTIVNISSAAGMNVMPLLAGYSGAKGYVAMLSQGINSECKGSNVTVSCQVPFFVATKLAKLRPSLMTPTPKAYAKLGMKWIGQGDVICNPFSLHAVQQWVIDTLPLWFTDPIILSMHKGIRKRGLKKKAAKSA